MDELLLKNKALDVLVNRMFSYGVPKDFFKTKNVEEIKTLLPECRNLYNYAFEKYASVSFGALFVCVSNLNDFDKMFKQVKKYEMPVMGFTMCSVLETCMTSEYGYVLLGNKPDSMMDNYK
mgnify:CR=1 FL=1